MVKKRKAFQKNTKTNKKISKEQTPQADKPSTTSQLLDKNKKIELRKEKDLPAAVKVDPSVDSKKIEIKKNKEVKTASKSVFSNKSFFKLVLFFLLGLIIGLSVSILAINKEIDERKGLDSPAINVGEEAVGQVISAEEAGEKAINAINEYILEPQGITASLVGEIVTERGLHRMILNIEGQKSSVYLTKDGALFFPEAIDIEALIAAPPASEATECEKFQAELTPERKVKIAKCLAEKGYKIYYADWCPFCVQQKELFGEAAKYLYGFDCYDPEGGRGNIAKCPDLLGVPAWRDRDGNQLKYNGEVIDGMIQIRRLVAISDCDF